jgi:hypothetical protein
LFDLQEDWKNGFRFAYGQLFGFPLTPTLRRCLATGAACHRPHKIGIETSCFDAVLVAGVLPWFGTNAGGFNWRMMIDDLRLGVFHDLVHEATTALTAPGVGSVVGFDCMFISA